LIQEFESRLGLEKMFSVLANRGWENMSVKIDYHQIGLWRDAN
jgi:hypothetical protein